MESKLFRSKPLLRALAVPGDEDTRKQTGKEAEEHVTDHGGGFGGRKLCCWEAADGWRVVS